MSSDTLQSGLVMKKQPRTRHRHRLPQIIHIFHLVSFANLLESTGQKIPPRHILGSTLIRSPGRWPKVAIPSKTRMANLTPATETDSLSTPGSQILHHTNHKQAGMKHLIPQAPGVNLEQRTLASALLQFSCQYD